MKFIFIEETDWFWKQLSNLNTVERYMLQDRLKWNEKYQTASSIDEPAVILKKYIVPGGGQKALDIAAGNGRNALFLAEQGFKVDAIDISDAGLRLFAGKHPNVHPMCADLDHFDIPANRYALIINIKFLNRRLFPYIRDGLTPGGTLIFQTFLDTPAESNNRRHCRDYLLHENELLHAFLSLRVLFYREAEERENGEISTLASLVAMKAR
jgi:tellurite methyltransferase